MIRDNRERLIDNAGLVKLNVDTLTDRRVKQLWVSFIVSVLILYIMTAFIPPPRKEQDFLTGFECPADGTRNSSECLPFNLKTNPTWVGTLNEMTFLNNFFIVEMKLIRKKFEEMNSVSVNVTYNFSLVTLNTATRKIQEQVSPFRSHSTWVECHKNSITCDNKLLAYWPKVHHDNYQAIVHINNGHSLGNEIETIEFRMWSMNPAFTEFLLILRYIFVIVATATGIRFTLRVERLYRTDRIFEQKYLIILSVAVVLFNDPTAIITIFFPNILSGLISTIFVCSFFSFLFLFWLCQFDRIANENEKKTTKTVKLWKILLMIIVWLILVCTYTIMTYLYQHDPSINWSHEHETLYDVFKYLSITVLGVVVSILGYYAYHIFKKWETRLERHKNLALFSGYFLFCTFLFVFTSAISIYNTNGSQIFLFISISNLYIFYLQYLFSPSREGLKESETYKRMETLRLYNQYETTTDENTVEIRFENTAQEETLERSNHSGDNTFRAHEIELAYVQGQQERRILEDSPKESNPGLLNNSGEEDHEEASEEQTN